MKRQFYILITCSVICIFHWQILAAQQSNEDTEFQRLVLIGVDNLQEDELKDAINVCKAYIQKHDKDPDKQTMVAKAHLIKGQILRRQEYARLDIVIGELRNGLRRDSTSFELNREIGITLKDMEKFAEARSYLESAVELNPKDRLAWRALIELNDKYGNSEQKTSAYQGYLTVDPTNISILTKLGKEYINLGEKIEAESSFVQALRIDSRQTAVRLQLASLREERNDWAGAIEQYYLILQDDPQNSAVNKRHDVAQKELQRHQTITSELKEGTGSLSSVSYKDWESGIAHFGQVLTLDEQNAQAMEGIRIARKKLCDYWFEVARQKEMEGDWENALDYYTTSLANADADSDKVRAFERQKIVARRLGRILEARNAQEAAEKALLARQFPEAIKQYFIAEALDPNLKKEVQPHRKKAEIGENYQLGVAALNDKKYDIAKSYFAKVMAENEQHGDVKKLSAMADSLAKLEVQIEFLKTHYKEAIQGHHWHIGRSHLKELLAYDPNNQEYSRDLERIEREILSERIWFWIRNIIFISACVLLSLLYNKSSREALLQLINNIFGVFQHVLIRPLFAILLLPVVISIHFYLVSIKVFPPVTSLPGATILGLVTFLVITVTMALMHKKINMTFKLKSSHLSFMLERSSAKNLQQHTIISQPPEVEFIHFKLLQDFKIKEGKISESIDAEPIGKDDIVFKPLDRDKNGSIQFWKEDKRLSLFDFKIAENSLVSLVKTGNFITLELKSRDMTESILNIGEQFRLKVSGCEIFSRGNHIRTVSHNEALSLYADLPPFSPVIVIQGSDEVCVLEIKLHQTQTYKNLKHPFIFHAPVGENLVFQDQSLLKNPKNIAGKIKHLGNVVAEGSVTMIDYQQMEIKLSDGLYFKTKPNFFNNLVIGINNKNFLIEYKGEFSSLKVGDPKKLTEKIPSALSWFLAERKDLARVIVTVSAIAGLIIAVLDYIRK